MALTRTQRIALTLQLTHMRLEAGRGEDGSTSNPLIEDGESLLQDSATQSALTPDEFYRVLIKDSPYDPESKSPQARERMAQLEELADTVIARKGSLYSRQPLPTVVDGLAILMVDESDPIVDPLTGLSTSYQDLLDLEQSKCDAELSGYENEILQILQPDSHR